MAKELSRASGLASVSDGLFAELAGNGISVIAPSTGNADPLIQRRGELIEREGGNAFMDYMLPRMLLRLKQMIGCLIRTTTDRGIVVIVEPRCDRRYFPKILDALPPEATGACGSRGSRRNRARVPGQRDAFGIRKQSMIQEKMMKVRSKAVALGRLFTTSNAEFAAFMGTYQPLFTASPENTRADYDDGVSLQGYKQGSSSELEQYYKIIHLLCTLGSVEKMYMPPVMDVQKSVVENQNLFERQLAKDLDVAAGDPVLDLGCGCGAIAAHIATLTGCTVHGINIDKSQIEKAWQNPNLSQRHFTVGDFNKPLDFDDNMFDAVYNVQALTYATDLEFTFKEVFRVLKPGGKFAVNDVAALDNYDRENKHHKLLIQHTRELTAFGGFWHYKYWEDAFKNAGFEMISSAGKSAVEMIRKEVALYDRFEKIFSSLSTMRLIPRKIDAMVHRMNTNCESYIKAEEEELLTLNWKYVAQKPERA